MTYARVKEDLAVLAINTFRKDATERVNPLIRGLAARMMGMIGMPSVVEYLLMPLEQCLNDIDAYVRKSAALSVAKVYKLNPERVTEQGLTRVLSDLLAQDECGTVVANAAAAIQDIKAFSGKPLWFALDKTLVDRMLKLVAASNEWARISILDFLSANYSEFTPNHIRLISPYLASQNPGLVLSAARLISECSGDKSEAQAALQGLLNHPAESIRFLAVKLSQHPAKLLISQSSDPIFLRVAKLEAIQPEPQFLDYFYSCCFD